MQQIGNNLFTLMLVLIGGFLLYQLSPILTPFLIGILLAYLADPLVRYLVRLKLPRLISVIIVFLILFIVIISMVLSLIPLVQDQIDTLAIVIPNIVAWMQHEIFPWLQLHMGINTEIINVDTLKSMLAENWTKASGVADVLIKGLLHSGFKVIEWMVNLVLIPVVTFYLLCDWDKVVNGVRSLIPRQSEPTVVKLVKECDSVLSAFFRGQLLVMLSLGIIYSIGLSIVGLQIGVIIGLIAGLLSIVPYLGTITGVLVATIAAVVQFGTFTSVMLVWLVFVIGHLIDHMVLTPYLVGNQIGLHPVAVIFAILAGGCLFGFLGVLLALPVAAVIMVWVRYLQQRYFDSKLYQQK